RPVILAWPAQMTWPRWTMLPYLGLAMFQSVPLAAILTFSDRVIYTRYSSVEDQALAGVIMWVPGSIPLLLPILRVIVELSSARVGIEGRHACFDTARRDRGGRLRRPGRGEGAPDGRCPGRPGRSAKPPPVPAALVSGGHGGSEPGADRLADSQH